MNIDLHKARQARLSTTRLKDPQERFEAKPTRKSAIDFYCWSCQGERKSGVTQCEIDSCPLWQFRPWQQS